MADEQQLAILREGHEAWNRWRMENRAQQIDLTHANLAGEVLLKVDLSGADLSLANLSGAILIQAVLTQANFKGANLEEAKLGRADLTGACLDGANLLKAHFGHARLSRASLSGAHVHTTVLCAANLAGAHLADLRFTTTNLLGADLTGADLRGASLRGADLDDVNLSNANLSYADLSQARLIRTRLDGADLHGADLRRAVLTEASLVSADLTETQVYGLSAWNTRLDGATQEGIVITDEGEPTVTVDNLEVAQFIYLLLHSEKIRHVIDTITSKVVLILGRFTKERKVVLDAIRERLRLLDYTPVMFDFEKPTSRDFTETVSTLAHMARFIIPDLTDERSVPQELQAIVPNLAIPVLPIVHEDHKPWGMWQDFYKYGWVLTEHRYRAVDQLLSDLEGKLIPEALEKIPEIERLRCRRQRT